MFIYLPVRLGTTRDLRPVRFLSQDQAMSRELGWNASGSLTATGVEVYETKKPDNVI